jgi:hypothetical protein
MRQNRLSQESSSVVVIETIRQVSAAPLRKSLQAPIVPTAQASFCLRYSTRVKYQILCHAVILPKLEPWIRLTLAAFNYDLHLLRLGRCLYVILQCVL